MPLRKEWKNLCRWFLILPVLFPVREPALTDNTCRHMAANDTAGSSRHCSWTALPVFLLLSKHSSHQYIVPNDVPGYDKSLPLSELLKQFPHLPVQNTSPDVRFLLFVYNSAPAVRLWYSLVRLSTLSYLSLPCWWSGNFHLRLDAASISVHRYCYFHKSEFFLPLPQICY